MRRHDRIETMLDIAQSEHRCVFGTTPADRRALLRRAREGSLASPYRNVYARTGYWNELDAPRRSNHVAKALAKLHPSWVFAGLTAATLHGLDHAYALHAGCPVFVASPFNARPHDHTALTRIRMREIPVTQVDGVNVTDMERTLLDCGIRYRFHEALPLFDAAAKTGFQVTSVLTLCRRLHLDTLPIHALVTHTDAHSENGGESLARAIMITQGFVPPRTQYQFENPDNPAGPYRADFTWILQDGRIIVAEYDGMGKYAMSRSSIRSVVHMERRREEHLRAQGVTVIVRFEFEDVRYPERLERKLLEAGVPRCR